jgi:AcrR family transcriptional regulator
VKPTARRRRPLTRTPSRKASNTRFRILEAALDSIIELGYAGTSISTIAQRAAVSRGAMQFHFPTQQAAIEALIGHLAQRRLDLYRADLARIEPGKDFLDHAIDVYWRQVSRPEFIAQQELALAARHDPRLAAHIARGFKEFVRHSRAPFLDEFPRWRELGMQYETAANLAQYLLEGMASGLLCGHLDQQAIRRLLASVKDQVRGMLEDGSTRSRRKRPPSPKNKR